MTLHMISESCQYGMIYKLANTIGYNNLIARLRGASLVLLDTCLHGMESFLLV